MDPLIADWPEVNIHDPYGRGTLARNPTHRNPPNELMEKFNKKDDLKVHLFTQIYGEAMPGPQPVAE